MRAITREIDGKSRTLFTSLADPTRWAADEVFALYHERWEIEFAYGEIKTDILRQAMTLRSQHPQGIEQELWATLLMYKLIRLEITRIADEANVQPCRINFITALRYIIDEWLWSAAALRRARSGPSCGPCARTSAASSFPPRRSERRYPRTVRMTKTHYPIKKNTAQT